MNLTGVGVWSGELRFGDPAEAADSAAELESLGYTAAWIPDLGGPVYEALDRLLQATSSIVVATGILNIWMQTAPDVVAWWGGLDDAQRRRVMLGLGVSHGPLVGDAWGKPLATMRTFLDGLEPDGPPAEHLCIAALGPKMLGLARDRTAGSHPYLVTPEHTVLAREILGNGGLYVEQGVVLSTDPDAARAAARGAVDFYCSLPNYVNNWKRLGFTDADVESRSDRLIDGLFAWGDAAAIRARVDAHRQAGADHVCIQVVTVEGQTARQVWRELAPALLS